MTSSSIQKSGCRIHVLTKDIANKIAAGEVIERPASVVKELVENAVDARATLIVIDIENAGKELIRVSDNGDGMNLEEARKAFERHATSKIANAEDLDGILTLGFRGEALPSIASVSKVRLKTCANEQQGGAEVVVEGGSEKNYGPLSRLKGTTLEVRQIFYNTPARKKFLKRDSTELAHISQVVTQQALMNPQIHFKLKHNGRQVLNALMTDQLLYRSTELLGSELAREFISVEAHSNRYHLEGFISSPVFTRSTNASQYFYVNGRFIRDKVILHATQQGYAYLLPKGKYPVIVLKLSMDPELLDVNVHPAKAEVRFAFQQEVHQFVSKSIRDALGRREGEPFEKKSSFKGAPVALKLQPENHNETKSLKTDLLSPTTSGSGFHADVGFNRSSGSIIKNTFINHCRGNDREKADEKPISKESKFEMFEERPLPVSHLIYSDFESLGQLENSFIVMQGAGGLLIVDQHIAHERILYERFRKAAEKRNIEIQQLIFPISIEFPPYEWEMLNSQLDALRSLGLEIEPFGGNGFLLRAVPAILKHADHEALLRDIVEELRDGDGSRSVEERYDEILIMMACRNAIKVNHPLDSNQIRKLLQDLEQTEMPFTCPHGRPIAVLMGMDTILKRFLRK